MSLFFLKVVHIGERKEKKRRRVARSDDSNHVANLHSLHQHERNGTEWNGTEPKPPSRSFYPITEIETQIFHKRKVKTKKKGRNSSSTFSRDGNDCGIKQLGRTKQLNWHLATFFLFLHQVYVALCTLGNVRSDLMNEALVVNNVVKLIGK